jgi:hypothetical protein
MVTFGYCEEPNWYNRISMRAPDCVVHRSDREIKGVVFNMARRHGNSGLVTAKDYGAVHCPIRARVGLIDIGLRVWWYISGV